MGVWRTPARRAGLIAVVLVSLPALLVLSGCVVDEKEPGPNVYSFNYQGFADLLPFQDALSVVDSKARR
jgi:hypothetical protein